MRPPLLLCLLVSACVHPPHAVVPERRCPPAAATSEAAVRREQATRRRYAELRSLFEGLSGPRCLCSAMGTQFFSGRASLILPTSCFFAEGKAELLPGARANLERLALALKNVPGRRYLVGSHLRDKLQVTAPFTSRWALAAAQAVALVEALVASGLPAARLTAVAFGDVDEPQDYDGPAQLAPGDNSLIEIALVPTFEEVPPPR